MGKLMRYLFAAVLVLAMASAGICASDVWKVGTVHGLFQYEISAGGSELLFFEQPRNDNGWFWWNNNGSPYGTLATGGFGPNGYRDGSRTFAMSEVAAGQKLKDIKLEFTYYNPWGYTTMNFFITDGRGRYGIFAPTSAGIGAFAQYTVNGEWTTITVDLTNTSIPDSTSVAVYEHNGLKAVYGEPYTTFTWGEIKDYTIAGMYDYQRSPHYGWGAWAEVFGAINSSWTPFVVRNATSSGNPPAINDVVEGGVLAKEFVIAEGGQKAAWGTRMLDGKKVKDIEGHILRLDDYGRFAAGSGPRVAPYFNIWVTDGNGKFAVIANEPSNPEWTGNPGSQWNFDWAVLKTKTAKAYENSDKTWLPNNGVGMTFEDLADYTILPPTPAQLSAGWPGLGGGAPRELGTNKAYGFNWVFGDTLSNYVSGDPGYVVAQPDIRKDAPALVNGYGIALIWGDTVGNTTYVTQKRRIKDPVITFGGTDYEGTFEDSSVPNLLFLTPETTYAKPGAPVVLGLYQANLQTPVAGYQAFLGFDAGMLDITIGNVALTATPYVLQLIKAVASGEVDLAAGVNYGDPGTTQDAQLATLTFTAGTTEGVTRVTFRDTDPPTRFTDDEGNEVRTAAVESGDIVIDGTPPTITCPDDVVVSTDAGVCFATGVDLGTPVTGDNLSGVDSVTNDAPAQFPKGETTVTWTVTDKAGNFATCEQKVTVTDNENPTITAPGDVIANTDTGVCYATITDLGTPTFADNCPGAIVTNDAPANNQYPKGDTTVTWTVTDASGNKATDTQTVTVHDSEDPVITCPGDIQVYALPNSSEASVDPGTATATDNCDVQSVVGTRSDSKPLDDPYPVGVTTITWVATDTSSNTAQCQQTITVLNKNEATITVELESVTASPTREIEFQFGGDGSGANTATVYANVVFTSGTGTVTVEVPAGVQWTCVTAKDRQHTLRSQTALGVAGGKYTASFTGSDKLIGGDLTNDNLVDILDFGVFAGQYGTAYPGYRAWPNRDADISADGQVQSADFTYIQTHFLGRGEALCGGAADAAAGLAEPVTTIRLRDLSRIIGAKAAYAADVNKDGIIDLKDVELFVQRNIAGAR